VRIYFEFRWNLKKTLTSHLTFLVFDLISTLESASFDFFCLFGGKGENKELKSASLFSPLFDLFYPFFCGRAALCLRFSTRILSKCGLNCMCLRCLISHLLLSRSPWNLHSHPLQDVSVRAVRPQISNSAFFIWITSFVVVYTLIWLFIHYSSRNSLPLIRPSAISRIRSFSSLSTFHW